MHMVMLGAIMEKVLFSADSCVQFTHVHHIYSYRAGPAYDCPGVNDIPTYKTDDIFHNPQYNAHW